LPATWSQSFTTVRLAAAPLLLAVAGLSSRALGQPAETQTAAAPVRERASAPVAEVEHGWYFRGSGGAFYLTSLPATRGPKPFSAGQMAQIELGGDLAGHLALGLFVMGTANRAGSDYVGKSDGTASGDFSAIIPGVAARLSLIGLPDANGVRRTWLYVRGGIGYAMFFPKALLSADTFAFAGPGIEYYTRLRHFSIGLEVTGSYLVKSKTFGFALAPNLRYAF
jgi:hypothetical protein